AEPRLDDLRELATNLLRQGEHCASAGLPRQAVALLTQAWTAVVGRDTDLASASAWDTGWLLVRIGAYAEAADWFSRVVTLPPQASDRWPSTRQALGSLCLMLASQPPQQMAVPLSPPLAQPSGPSSAPPLLKVTNLGHFQVVRGEQILP